MPRPGFHPAAHAPGPAQTVAYLKAVNDPSSLPQSLRSNRNFLACRNIYWMHQPLLWYFELVRPEINRFNPSSLFHLPCRFLLRKDFIFRLKQLNLWTPYCLWPVAVSGRTVPWKEFG
jgi:hypothetical protein